MEGKVGMANEVIEGLEVSLADNEVARVNYHNGVIRGYRKLDNLQKERDEAIEARYINTRNSSERGDAEDEE